MFKHFEKAIFRIPLFPLNALFNKNNETYDLDFLAKEFLENEIFLEAVFWSSPAFYKILLDYSEGKISDEKRKRKVLNTINNHLKLVSIFKV